MNYKQALAAAAEQGAIRVYASSKGWHVVYRIQDGQMQARNLNKVNETDWALGANLAGWASGKSEDGWHTVQATHFGVQPIENEEAKQNLGYYHGLSRRCESCKQEKSPTEFQRDMTSEIGFRTWECNDCAAERAAEVAGNTPTRSGDIIRRDTHASNPPVESEI